MRSTTSRARRLPNLLVIGAQKGGTSSLHRYLGLHPQVFMSETKELDFFSGPDWNWDRGVDWYRSQFEGAGDEPIRGESSPSYTMNPWVPGVPERIREVVPDAKLVYVVRDPIDRMVSQYVHYRSRGYTRQSFSELASIDRFDESDYVLFSRYAMQLERYLEWFPEERILVLAHEDLLAEREQTLARVFRFLGVDEDFRSEDFAATHNVSRVHAVQSALNRVSGGRVDSARFERLVRRFPPLGWMEARFARPPKRPDIDDSLRDRLAGYVADDAARLRRITGERFPSWSV